jgi:hypothetical protein
MLIRILKFGSEQRLPSNTRYIIVNYELLKSFISLLSHLPCCIMQQPLPKPLCMIVKFLLHEILVSKDCMLKTVKFYKELHCCIVVAFTKDTLHQSGIGIAEC